MEIERMWQLKTSVIPIVVGALVLVKRGTAKHLKKILGKQNLAEMQKILLTSTEHIKKSVINISYNTKDQRKMKTQNLKKKKKKNIPRSCFRFWVGTWQLDCSKL